MTNNQKIFLWLGVGVATAVGGYFLFRHFTKQNEGGDTFREVEEEETSSANFPLKKGSRGAEVKTLQQYINRSPKCKAKMPKSSPNTRIAKLLPLDEDGIFGDLTLSALRICYNTDTVDEKLFEKMEDALPKLSI